jgi:hypothetical protein
LRSGYFKDEAERSAMGAMPPALLAFQKEDRILMSASRQKTV